MYNLFLKSELLKSNGVLNAIAHGEGFSITDQMALEIAVKALRDAMQGGNADLINDKINELSSLFSRNN